MRKKNSVCPKCKKGFLVWCEDGIIRCPQCGFVSPKTRKLKRNFQFEVVGLTIIDPKTHDIRIKPLNIRSNKKKKVLP